MRYSKTISLTLATLFASFGLVGCGSEDTADASSASSQNVVVDNDTYLKARQIAFNNGVATVSDKGNTSNDVHNWYSFITPQSGVYICGFKTDPGVDFELLAYHEGSEEVGGNEGSLHTYSDEYKDAGYDEITWIVMPVSGDDAKQIPQGSKIYLDMKAVSTGGNDAAFTIDCFAPSKYASVNQVGNVIEDNSLINYYFFSAHPVTLDETNSVTIHGMANSVSDKYDYFTFTTPVGGEYNLTLTHDNSVDIDVELLNPDKTDKGSFNNGSSSPQSWEFEALAGAKYYLKVYAYDTDANDANYTITIQKK